MPYYIRLPDGRNVEFPDDYPRDQAQAVAARMAGETQAQQPTETAPAQPQRGSNMGVAGDIIGSGISGLGGIATAGGGLYGLATGDYDTGATRLGRRIQQYGETFMSPQLLEARERLDREMREAEERGPLAEVGVAARGILTDPRLATSFVAEQVPQFIGSLGVGRVAGGIGKLAARRGGAEAAEAAGRTAAVGAAIGTGTGLQTGEVANSTYEDIIKLAPEIIERSPNYQALRQTMTDEEARHQLGVEGSRVAAAIAAPISAGTAALFGAERFALGNQIKRRAIARVVLGASGEAAQEGTEEGGGRFAQNVGALRADAERDLTAGVGGAAARGAILGGIIGGGTGLISGRAPDPDARGQDVNLRGALDPYLSSISRAPVRSDQPDVDDRVRLVTENLPFTAEQFLGAAPEAQERLIARAQREFERQTSGENLPVLDPQGNRDPETANIRVPQSASRPSDELIYAQAGSRAEAFQFERGRGERAEGGITQAEFLRRRADELQRLTEQFPQIATTRVRDETTGKMRLLNAGERREMGLRLLEERGGQPTAAEATVAAAGQTYRPSLGTGAEQTAAAARAERAAKQPLGAFFPLVEGYIAQHVQQYGPSAPVSVPAFQTYVRNSTGRLMPLAQARDILSTYNDPAPSTQRNEPPAKFDEAPFPSINLRAKAKPRPIERPVSPAPGQGFVLDERGVPVAPKGPNTDADGRPLPPAAPPAAPLRAGPSGFTDPRQRELSARASEAQAPQAGQAETAQDTKAIKRATEIVNDRLNKIEKRGGKKTREAVEKVIRDGNYDAEQVYSAFMAADRIASLLPVGASHEIEFVDRLLINNAEAAKASGNAKAQEAQGERVRQTGKINQARFNQLMREGLTADQAFAVVQKEAVNGIIRLSLAPNQLPFLGETAAHEAFHVLQDYYAKYDPQFKNLMDKSFRDDMMIADVDPTIRRKLEQARFPGSDKSYWQALSATLPDALTAREAQAYVFGSLVDAAKRGTPMTGLKPAFARFVNFLRQFFTRMGNTMRGDGFQTAESMLARVGRGDAQRFGGRAAPTDEDFAAKAPELSARPVAEFGARDGRAGLTNEQAELSARATNTTVPEFKNWWTGGWRGEGVQVGPSVAANPDGSPVNFYHGTQKGFTRFGGARSGSYGQEGPYFFSRDPDFAGDYAISEMYASGDNKRATEGQRMLPVYLSAQNPFDSTDPEQWGKLLDYVDKGLDDGVVDWRDISSSSQIKNYERQIAEGQLSENRAASRAFKVFKNILESDKNNWASIETKAAQDYIRKNGFDSFWVAELDVKNLAVYDPRQIKSVFNRFEAGAATQPEFSARQVDATGIGTRVNNATPSNVRNKEFEIQYTRASDLVDRGLRKIPFVGKRLKPGAGEDLIILMQDRMLPLGRMVDVVRKNGGNVVDASDIYMTEELYHGRVGAAVDDRAQRLYKPVFDEMRRLNISLKDMDEYLEARHAPERNAFVKSINEDPSKGAGITDKEAAAIMQRLAPQKAKLDRVAKLVDAIVADTNKTRAESGLTPDYGKLNSKTNFKYYVPLRGFVEEDIFDDKGVESLRARTGQGFKIKGKEDRSIMGRTSRASNILGNVILQNEETVIRSEKNKVGQALVKLIRDNPQQSAGFAKILDKTPVEPRIVNGKVKLMASGLYKNRDDVMVVKEGGNEIAVEIYDERLAKALTGASGLGAENSSMVLRGLAGLNRHLATVNTTLNPEFLISNFARDLQTANINIKQYDTKGLGRKIISDVPMALAGARAAIRGGDMSGKWAQAYEDFRRAGGTTEYLGLRDIDSKLKQINNEVMGNKGPLVVRPFKTMLKLIEDYNSVAENAIRLSTFQALRDMGVSDAKAAQVAKNLTVNFNKGGQNRVLMNSLYLFYNASIQGSMAMINAIARSKRVRKYVAAIVTAGFMHDVINAMLSGMDEDERKIYDKIPESVLERNYVLMDPFGLTERGYYAFPMPYGFNAFFNMGRNLSRASRGEGEPMKTAGSIVMGFVDAFNPVGGTQSFFNFVAPTILDPFVDLYSNRNFANRPIVPEERGFGPPSPDSQRFWSNTFPPYVTVSQWLNQITGGTSVIPGQVDISPNTIGYLMNYATGAAGAFAERVAKFGFSTVPDMLTGDLEEVEVRDIPFVRKLYGNVTTRNDLESFMENTNRIGQIQREFKEAEQFGEGERLERAMQDYPRELAVAPLIEGLVRERRKITREMNQIRRDPNIDAESRRELLRVLKQEADFYVGQVNQLYNTQVRR